MASKKKNYKHTIRFGNNIDKDLGIFLYGNLDKISSARIYCLLHKCYLNGDDIREKKCNFKRCMYRKELNNK